MSADNSPLQDGKPERYATLPSFPEVIVTASRCDHEPGFVQFEHSSFPEDLIGAGVMTVAMTVPTRKHPRDPDGGHVSVTRYWRLREGAPHRYCRIRRSRPIAELAGWPGVSEALAAHAEYEAWDKERRPWAYEDAPGMAAMFGLSSPAALPRKPRPVLRLVIDNTREPRP